MQPATPAHVAPGDEAPGGGLLENTANNLSTLNLHQTPNRASRRRERWELRALLWSLSSVQRVRHCGRITRTSGHGPTVRHSEGVGGFAGLQHCGSVWSCPVCSSQILIHRALDIGAVLGQAVAEGFSLGFGTLTMRHRRTQPLRALWDAAGKGWQRAISGRGWQAIKSRHGVEGWVRVWEVTDGRNGWHVHVHFVVVLASGSTSTDLDAICAGMFDRWSRGLVDAGQEAPRLVGQEWHLVAGDQAAGQLSEYLFKLVEQGDRARSLGLELAHTQPGRARADLATQPVWSIVREVADTGDLAGLPRWHEWEAGSKGRRQVGWSKGLRQRFQPEVVEMTDEEIAAEERGTAADDVAIISVEGWARLVRIRGGCTDVLEGLEAHGVAGMVLVLDELGIEYELVLR